MTCAFAVLDKSYADTTKALQALSGLVRVSVFEFGSGTKKVGFLNSQQVSVFVRVVNITISKSILVLK